MSNLQEVGTARVEEGGARKPSIVPEARAKGRISLSHHLGACADMDEKRTTS